MNEFKLNIDSLVNQEVSEDNKCIIQVKTVNPSMKLKVNVSNQTIDKKMINLKK